MILNLTGMIRGGCYSGIMQSSTLDHCAYVGQLNRKEGDP